MKKLLLLFGLATASLLSAQAAKGSYVLETAVLSETQSPNTGLAYTSVEDGVKAFNVGVNGGYFLTNDFAMKLGVGYGQMRYEGETLSEAFSYRVGVEAQVVKNLLAEVAWTGSTITGVEKNPSYLSTQLGYNIFLSHDVAMKPLVRYNVALTEWYPDVLSFGVGFSYYFN